LVEKLKNKFVEKKIPERAMGICKRNGSKFSPKGAVCFSSNQGKTLTPVKSKTYTCRNLKAGGHPKV